MVYIDRITRLPSPPPLTSIPLLPELARAPPSEPTPTPSRRPTPLLNSFTLHRLLMSTLLVSSKFINDGAIPQNRAAKVGGVSMAELVKLEVDVLSALKWELKFTLEELDEVAGLCLEIGEREGVVKRLEAEKEQEEVGSTSAEATSSPVESRVEEVTSDTPHLTPTLPTPPPLERPPPPRQTDSQLSSVASSTSSSPRLFSPTAPRSPVASPPSSAGGDSDDERDEEQQRKLGLRASFETVRRMERLFMGGDLVDAADMC